MEDRGEVQIKVQHSASRVIIYISHTLMLYHVHDIYRTEHNTLWSLFLFHYFCSLSQWIFSLLRCYALLLGKQKQTFCMMVTIDQWRHHNISEDLYFQQHCCWSCWIFPISDR
jgi:hypothetical protein